MRSAIRIKRVYDSPAPEDGARFLVDRLWPRGVSKDRLALDGWLRDVAPSDALRRGFCHEPARWSGFVQRYTAELDRKPEAWRPLVEAARRGTVTLVFAARDAEQNNAAALRDYLSARLRGRRTTEAEA